ncbi:hypothetical protein OF83DRAFT_1019247, partial [Amylostereum chailletii]
LHALIIGINKYAFSGIPDLAGAVADARAMKEYLKTQLGVPEDQITSLYDSQATKKAILDGLSMVIGKIQCRAPVLIYYAGYGA